MAACASAGAGTVVVACEGGTAAGGEGGRKFSLGAALRASKSGKLVVVSVVADGPCSRAGVRKGDVVVAVCGERVRTLDQVAARLALAGGQAHISVTLRSAARDGQTFDVVLHRAASGERKSTTDVAEALRKIAASPSAGKIAGDSPGRRERDAAAKGASAGSGSKTSSRAALQAIGNQKARAQDLNCDEAGGQNSWIVAIAPGCENAPPLLDQRAAAGGAQRTANRFRADESSPQRRLLAAGSPDSALTVASPSSPPPAQHGRTPPRHVQTWEAAQMQVRVQRLRARSLRASRPPSAHCTWHMLAQVRGTYVSNSPLPEISPGSALLRSLSVSLARSGRGLGEESFSHELQQMHSLLVQSGEAIASLKDELLDMKDSKVEVRPPACPCPVLASFPLPPALPTPSPPVLPNTQDTVP